MGLLYTDRSVRTTVHTSVNNTLKINACSGGIYKTYKESWFVRFNLESKLAEKLFKPYDNKLETAPRTRTGSDYCDSYGYMRYVEEKNEETVIILQMVICGDMEVIAEVIKETDFNRYFEKIEECE